jgi:cell division protease FtsH
MDETLGHVAYEARKPLFLDLPAAAPEGFRPSEETARRIDEAVRGLIMGLFARTSRLLQANRAVLERCAQRLLEKETLEEAELRELTGDLQPESGPARAAA